MSDQIKLKKQELSTLKLQLTQSHNEKDVENAWRSFLTQYYTQDKIYHNVQVSSPYNTDGYITIGGMGYNLRLLMEFKYNTSLSETSDRVGILAQLIHYMYQFRLKGDDLPNILLGADEDSAFIVYAPNFYHYLEEEFNWGIAPSSAVTRDIPLYRALMEDSNTQAFVYDVSGEGDLFESNIKGILREILEYMSGDSEGEYTIPINQQNILKLFGEFSSRAFIHTRLEDIDPVDEMSIFMNMLVGGDAINYFQHPNDPNILVANGRHIHIDGAFLNMFIKRFNRDLEREQIDELNAIADRLIEDSARRDTGDFWTPEIWANRSHEILDEVIGSDWRETSLVWDPAAGAKNLTRSKQFSELYTSTLHEGEILLGAPYNQEAIETFQYDFLNDDVRLDPSIHTDASQWKLPGTLFNALIDASKTNKRVIFYTNPPYGANGSRRLDGKNKAGIAKTQMNELMRSKKMGVPSQQLYAQFFMRVIKLVEEFELKNVYIAFFTPVLSFTGASYGRFNEEFFSRFEHVKGNLFNAGDFEGTSGNWGVTFSVYKLRDASINKDTAKHQRISLITEEVGEENHVNTIGTKTFDMVYQGEGLNKWVNEDRGKKESIHKYPVLVSAFKEPSRVTKRAAKLLEGSMGFIHFSSNDVSKAPTYIYVLSSASSDNNGFNVFDSNFERAVVALSARRVIEPNWMNDRDQFKIPNTQKQGYKEFVNDCLVMSLFESKSYQASYRDFKDYTNCNRPGRWVNEWFWMDIETVRQHVYDLRVGFIYDDARNDTDRYVAKQIQSRTFSEEAQRVLDLATALWVDTLKGRTTNRALMEEFHLNAWDAGWYQLKQLNKYYPSLIMDDLNQAIKDLRDKIEVGVYHYEMLVK